MSRRRIRVILPARAQDRVDPRRLAFLEELYGTFRFLNALFDAGADDEDEDEADA